MAALNLKPVYALVGSDEASRHVRVEALKSAFRGIHGDLTLEAYDASSTQPAEVLMSLMSTSLLSGNRIVLVRQFEKWSTATKGAADESVMSIAVDYLSDPDPGTVLLLVGERMPKKTKAWKELAAAITAKGKLLEYELPREWDLYQWVIEKAAENGLSMDKGTAEYLISVAGTDSMTLYNELSKIADYQDGTGRSQVSKGDIDILVMPRNHMSEFKFIEALSGGDMTEAERILAQLGGKTDASKLVFVVARELRMMAELSSLLTGKASDAKMKSVLKAGGFFRAEPSDWVLRQLKKRAGTYNDERLVRALRTLSSLDYRLKGGGRSRQSERFMLELFMYEMSR